MSQIYDLILEFINGIWSRRWYGMAMAWFVCLAGWGAVATLPDEYEASSQIYVDTSSVLRPLLEGIAVEPNVEDEVRLMRQTLLSRGNVLTVMRMTDLDLTVNTKEDENRMISVLQKNTSVSGGSARSNTNLFTIGFTYEDPVKARDIVQAFTTVFVENNIGENREDSDVARDFLDEQIQLYRKQLEESEKRLADFEQKYRNILPESVSAVFNNYQSTKATLNEAIAQRDRLKQQLSAINPYIESVDAARFGEGPPSFEEVEVAKLEAMVESLRAQYTEKHPDVVVAKRRLEAMQKKIEEKRAAYEKQQSDGSSSSASVTREPNPVYDALKIELVKSETQISVLQERLRGAEENWRTVKETVDQAPFVEADRVKLQRDYGIEKRKYEQLLERQQALKIGTERSLKSDDVKFRIVEPPVVPLKPSGPNRSLFLNAVLAMGLGAGVGTAGLLAFTRKTFQTVRSLRLSFDIPIFGSIQDQRTGGFRAKSILNFLGLISAGGGLLAVLLFLLLIEGQFGLPNIVDLDNPSQSIEKLERVIDKRILG